MKLGQLISLGILFILLSPYFSLAQVSPPESFTPPNIPTQFFSCSPNDTLRQCMLRLLSDALKVLLVVALALAALFFTWAGLTYIFDPSKKDDAKNRIIWATVGLVVAFLSWVAVVMIQGIVSGGPRI